MVAIECDVALNICESARRAAELRATARLQHLMRFQPQHDMIAATAPLGAAAERRTGDVKEEKRF